MADTRAWGPSGWQALHYFSIHREDPGGLLKTLPYVLPCKFCRASSAEFMKRMPYDPRDPGRWVYDLHCLVNDKLRRQVESGEVSGVVVPPDPSWASVKRHYEHMVIPPHKILGFDWYALTAYNWDCSPEAHTAERRRAMARFFKELGRLYPVPQFQREPAPLGPKGDLLSWVIRGFSEICSGCETLSDVKRLCRTFRSTCSRPKFRGKTCRKPRRKPYRLIHARLI